MKNACRLAGVFFSRNDYTGLGDFSSLAFVREKPEEIMLIEFVRFIFNLCTTFLLCFYSKVVY